MLGYRTELRGGNPPGTKYHGDGDTQASDNIQSLNLLITPP